MPYEIEYTLGGKIKTALLFRDKRKMEREYQKTIAYMKAFHCSGELKKYYISPDGTTREPIE